MNDGVVVYQNKQHKFRQSILTFCNGIWTDISYYKNRICVALVLCVMSILFLGMFTTFCEYQQGDGFVGTLQGWVTEIFGTGVIEDVRGLLHIDFDLAGSKLELGPFSLSSLAPLVSYLYQIFTNLGYAFLMLYFLVGLIEEVTFNHTYTDKMLQKAIFLIVGIVLIKNSVEVTYFITGLGAEVVERIADLGIASLPNYDALCQEIYDNCTQASASDDVIEKLGLGLSDFVNMVSYLLQLFIPWIACKFVGLAIQMKCWSRFFEILFMAIMSPVAFSDISKGHLEHSGALRAVKNMIAVSFSGAIILLVCIFCNQIQGTLIQSANFGSAIWNCVLISVVQWGLISRSTEIVKSSLGMA